MASIEARRQDDGSVRFRARITVRGYPRTSRTFTRKTDAKRWARQTEVKILEGRLFPIQEARKRTFADLLDRYLAGHAKRIEPRRARQLLWWRDRLGAYALSQVTAPMIAEMRDALADRAALDLLRKMGEHQPTETFVFARRNGRAISPARPSRPRWHGQALRISVSTTCATLPRPIWR